MFPIFHVLAIVLVVLLSITSDGQCQDLDALECAKCEKIRISSKRERLLTMHHQILGDYVPRLLRSGSPALMNGRPTFRHLSSANTFLYYSSLAQGFWAVGESLRSDIVRLENQGNGICPYRLKSTWRYADSNLVSLVYDATIKIQCLTDPCSMADCGQGAYCDNTQDDKLNLPSTCKCDTGYEGDATERCFPNTTEYIANTYGKGLETSKNATELPDGLESLARCQCRELLFHTQNPVVMSKHRTSFGHYFLYGVYMGRPVYQHFAGVEYIYWRNGNWLISDEIGLKEASIQNQGDAERDCPYAFRTTWEYADVDQPGWQWVYDYTARLQCMDFEDENPCQRTLCGFHANCSQQYFEGKISSVDAGINSLVSGAEARINASQSSDELELATPKIPPSRTHVVKLKDGTCHCDAGYSGNPRVRCYPSNFDPTDTCPELVISSTGSSALAQADKMGLYFLFEREFNGRPVYQHQSGLDYLFYSSGDAWVIGAEIGSSRVGIVNFDTGIRPYEQIAFWRHSVAGRLRQDSSLTVSCHDTHLPAHETQIYGNQLSHHSNQRIDLQESDAWEMSLGDDGQPYSYADETIEAMNLTESDTKMQLPETSTFAPSIIESDHQAPSFENFEPLLTPTLEKIDRVIPQSAQANNTSTFEDPANATETLDGEADLDDSTSGLGNVTEPGIVENIITSTQDPISRDIDTSTQDDNNELAAHPILTESVAETSTQVLFNESTTVSEDGSQLENITVVQLETETIGAIIVHPQTELPLTIDGVTTARYDADDSIEPIFTDSDNSTEMAETTPTSTSNTVNVTSKVDEIDIKILDICPCKSIFFNSTDSEVIKKHASQLGEYILHSSYQDRPVYKHAEREHYLYYDEGKGGNWLVNKQIGRLSGGLQNSKNSPECPYLLNTYWQFSDIVQRRWVYDPTMTLTCQTDPCSVKKCGSRSHCVRNAETGSSQCTCRPGFNGNPYERCYPNLTSTARGDQFSRTQPLCQPLRLIMRSSGKSAEVQRDKMGLYYLWGFYNSRPVYQHESGLDFIYMHKNNVWGVGPKIAGSNAGLLNFDSAMHCPFEVRTPWEYGIRVNGSHRREVDESLRLEPYNIVSPNIQINSLEKTTRQKVDRTSLAAVSVRQDSKYELQNLTTPYDQRYRSPDTADFRNYHRPQPHRGTYTDRDSLAMASNSTSVLPNFNPGAIFEYLKTFGKRSRYWPQKRDEQNDLESQFQDLSGPDTDNQRSTLSEILWDLPSQCDRGHHLYRELQFADIMFSGDASRHTFNDFQSLNSYQQRPDCLGLIVGPRHILTMTDCVIDSNPSNMRIILNKDRDIIHVAEYVKHYHEYILDRFGISSRYPSLSLIQTSSSVSDQRNRYAKCNNKALGQHIESCYIIDRDGTELRTVDVPVVQDPCLVVDYSTTRVPKNVTTYEMPKYVCAGHLVDKAECQLRSMSPLLCKLHSRAELTLTGILVEDSSCQDQPGKRTNVFLKLDTFTDWLVSAISG